MANRLTLSIGQHSSMGRKQSNQDFHGVYIPKEPQLSTKGIAIALADGISSSDVSQVASQSAVTSFLEDYYCTPDAWSVKTSAKRILSATNSWLYSQTRQSEGRYDKDRGYVCTFSAMVVKSTTAHLFHVGDTRIYRVHGNVLELLTTDHRVSVSPGHSYLSRALGIDGQIEIDYRSFLIEQGDMFMLATDGVYEHVDGQAVNAALKSCNDDLDEAAKAIAAFAFQQGSADNLTVQLVRIDALPDPGVNEIYQQLAALPFPPILEARMEFDGYTIVRELRGSSRSHIYLAVDNETNAIVVIKTLSTELQQDPACVERFLLEEWVARRIHSAHVLKPCLQTRKRNYIYLVTEFIDGQTLAQWMIDHPNPELETVRGIIDQIARGLRAFHRLEMLHQDVRPENIMIDHTGTVKIIDFGAAHVAGIMEMAMPMTRNAVPGAAHYAAPEYFLGESGSSRSDVFSLGVIAYQMLTGRLPYGSEVPKTTTKAMQRRLSYQSARMYDRNIPAWVDEALRKAVHPDPYKRYEDVDELVFDLQHPNTVFLQRKRPPLIERNPLVFWKGVSFALMVMVILLGVRLGDH